MADAGEYIRFDGKKRSIAIPLRSDTDLRLETTDMLSRCRVYMSGFKCQKGDYCDKLHRFPREDKVLCKDHKDGECQRDASDCWFYHPGTRVAKSESNTERPSLFQPTGHLMKILRDREAKKSK